MQLRHDDIWLPSAASSSSFLLLAFVGGSPQASYNRHPVFPIMALQDLPIEELERKFADSEEETVEAARKSGASGKTDAAKLEAGKCVLNATDTQDKIDWQNDTEYEDEDSEADLDWVDEIEGATYICN